jgi:hypothetical protein
MSPETQAIVDAINGLKDAIGRVVPFIAGFLGVIAFNTTLIFFKDKK